MAESTQFPCTTHQLCDFYQNIHECVMILLVRRVYISRESQTLMYTRFVSSDKTTNSQSFFFNLKLPKYPPTYPTLLFGCPHLCFIRRHFQVLPPTIGRSSAPDEVGPQTISSLKATLRKMYRTWDQACLTQGSSHTGRITRVLCSSLTPQVRLDSF